MYIMNEGFQRAAMGYEMPRGYGRRYREGTSPNEVDSVLRNAMRSYARYARIGATIRVDGRKIVLPLPDYNNSIFTPSTSSVIGYSKVGGFQYVMTVGQYDRRWLIRISVTGHRDIYYEFDPSDMQCSYSARNYEHGKKGQLVFSGCAKAIRCPQGSDAELLSFSFFEE